MSSQFPQSGAQQPGEGDGPSEEEVRQYLAQMRSAPADQVVAEVVQGLLNAAQVKLGRNDARLLIDVGAAINDTVRGRVGEELVGQVDQAVSQLRLAQVEAEREGSDQDEPNDLPDSGPPPAAGEDAGAPGGQQAPEQPQQPQQPSQTSKLWIPGQ